MADKDSQAQPSGAVAVTGTSRGADGTVAGRVTNGRVTRRDSDDIVAEIERTRQNLARTIDTLADRVSPSSNVRRLRERASEQLTRPKVQLAVLAVGLAVTGVVILRIWGRRRA